MNTLKSLVIKVGSLGLKTFLPLVVCGLTLPAFAALQWSSYDVTGTLISANAGTGGDLASGTSVTFTIPAGTTNFFVTKSFRPIILTQVNGAANVTFKFSASGGLTGGGQDSVQWGMYNSQGTATLADDVGMYGGVVKANYLTGLYHGSGNAYLFNMTSSPGLSHAQSSTMPSDGTTYTNQIRLFYKTAGGQVALGNASNGNIGNAGVAMNGADGVAYRSYTNPGNTGNTFDEFAIMFNNTTGNSVTITISALALGDTLTWDASGGNPVAPTDGSGIWSTTNANWSGLVGGATGATNRYLVAQL